jgi:hypothetical protein
MKGNNIMEFDKKVIVDVDGFIETGKQFDLDLKLPEDNRNVVYGIIRDCKGKPIEDAVVKLVEVCKMKENLYLILLQIKKVNLSLDRYALINLILLKFGLTE